MWQTWGCVYRKRKDAWGDVEVAQQAHGPGRLHGVKHLLHLRGLSLCIGLGCKQVLHHVRRRHMRREGREPTAISGSRATCKMTGLISKANRQAKRMQRSSLNESSFIVLCAPFSSCSGVTAGLQGAPSRMACRAPL